MKILFVIEHFYPYHDASAKVLTNLLLSETFTNHEIHVLTSLDRDVCDGQIQIHGVKYTDFFFRVKLKFIKNKFIKDRYLLNAFSKSLNAICNNHKFDHIIFVMGNMNLLYLSSKVNTKYSFIFYDPFISNFIFKEEDINKILKIENKAFENASNIFVLEEYLETYKKHHTDYKDKIFPFYLTAFYNNVIDQEKHTITKHTLLHAGSFFDKLREPYLFFDFLNQCEKEGLEVHASTLGILPRKISRKVTLPKNLTIVNRVFGEEYLDIISSSECLVLVDNCSESTQIPSKAYEYIGYNKKILFFSNGNTNTSRLLLDNKNVFKITNKLSENTINDFRLFLDLKTYNERIKYQKNEKDFVAQYLLGKLYENN